MSTTPQPTEASKQASNPETLLDLIGQHDRAYKEDNALWTVYGDVTDSVQAHSEYQVPRVQVGLLKKWGDLPDEPIYCFGMASIEEHVRRNHETIGRFFDRTEEQRQRREAHIRARIAHFGETLSKITERNDQLGREAGLFEARDQAVASSEKVKSIEEAIIKFVPASLADAAHKANFLVDRYKRECAYFDENRFIDALASIAEARQ